MHDGTLIKLFVSWKLCFFTQKRNFPNIFQKTVRSSVFELQLIIISAVKAERDKISSWSARVVANANGVTRSWKCGGSGTELDTVGSRSATRMC